MGDLIRVRLSMALVVAFGAAAAWPATITVTGTGDATVIDGVVTLREAITSLNLGGSVNADVIPVGGYGLSDAIHFAIAGAGPHVILIGNLPLPDLVVPATIDGYTQAGSSPNTLTIGNDAVIRVVLRGTTPGVHGLSLANGASGSVVRGLAVQSTFFGFQISGSGMTIAGNFIGTDVAGTSALGNGVGVNFVHGPTGSNTIGGAAPADRNLISGNSGSAMILNSEFSNQVLGNYIGVDRAGTAALPNGTGVVLGSIGATIGGPIIGGPTAVAGTGAGNVISGNVLRGIQIETSGSSTVIGPGTIQGNVIGLDATGSGILANGGPNIYIMDSDLPSTGVPGIGSITIGGAGAGNVLSGGGHGVYATAAALVLKGNKIGTDITGTLARPNGTGIELQGHAFMSSATIGGTAAGEGNLVSSNLGDAIRLYLTTATLEGNLVGVSSTGAALGNSGYGIFVDSGIATIGGTVAGAGNVVAYSGDTGINVRIGFPGVHNASEAAILGNSIHHNGILGINLSAPDLVTPNDPGDPDSGPNDLQNYPEVTTATVGGGNLSVSGSLDSTANTTFRVEVFANATCSNFGHGEGATFLGATSVTTNGGGLATFGPLNLPIPPGQLVITTTATSPTNHTSEFSECVVATPGGPVPIFSDGFASGNTSAWSATVPP